MCLTLTVRCGLLPELLVISSSSYALKVVSESITRSQYGILSAMAWKWTVWFRMLGRKKLAEAPLCSQLTSFKFSSLFLQHLAVSSLYLTTSTQESLLRGLAFQHKPEATQNSSPCSQSSPYLTVSQTFFMPLSWGRSLHSQMFSVGFFEAPWPQLHSVAYVFKAIKLLCRHKELHLT